MDLVFVLKLAKNVAWCLLYIFHLSGFYPIYKDPIFYVSFNARQDSIQKCPPEALPDVAVLLNVKVQTFSKNMPH